MRSLRFIRIFVAVFLWVPLFTPKMRLLKKWEHFPVLPGLPGLC